MQSFWREPLLGFLLLGALIFWIENQRADSEPIVFDPTVIDKLVEERELVLERPLTSPERDAIRQNFVDQEILLREAVRLDLHLSDGRVRHRLADKMMFLLVEEPAPPDGALLDNYYLEHKARYVTDRRVSFEHRFYGDDETLARDTLSGGTPDKDPQAEFFWLGNRLDRMSAQDLVSTFGVEFARSLESLPEGEWHGPVASNRGWHIVRILAWHPAVPIPREQLDERLRTEWLAEQRDRARTAALAELRERYDVVLRKAGEPGGG